MSVWDIALEWRRLAREAFPDHADHQLTLDQRGTRCDTCDITLVPPTSGADFSPPRKDTR